MSPRSKPKVRPAIRIHVDGAARGNPGPAGIGAVLTDGSGRKLREISLYLGETTNNVAETCALIVALQEAVRLSAREVAVRTDSELLARQVTGVYRVRDPRLQSLHVLIHHLVEGFDRFEIQHIPRKENRQADRLAGRAVSEALKRRLSSDKKPAAPPAADFSQKTFWSEKGI